MTTLVALASKDAVVMGCDSLATVSRPLVDPLVLNSRFFDSNGHLAVDEAGTPKLKSFNDIIRCTQSVPYNHMSHVDKLIPLTPLPLGVMLTGVAGLGDRTLKNLLTEFKESDEAFQRKTNYTVRTIADRLRIFLYPFYKDQFSDMPEDFRPALELLVAGYGRQKPGSYPSIYRVLLHKNTIEEAVAKYGIAFGGQMQEIERLVFGTDLWNRVRIEHRYRMLLYRYFQEVGELNPTAELPDPEEFADRHPVFGYLDPDNHNKGFWYLEGLQANWGDFSEQNAIDCVSFFIRVMIDAQRFNTGMPTVGGDIHIGLITRVDGFRFISREEYEHEQHRVPRTR